MIAFIILMCTLCYRKHREKTSVQKLAFAYWSFHYVKRILETFLVHR